MIGAGASGIAACKALAQRRVPFVCFEVSDRVGGLWVLNNRNGRSAAYRSLHINTSRDKSAFSDFPMPRRYPDYPDRAQVAEYLENYARHFGLTESIRFGVVVERVVPRADGRYDVHWGGTESNDRVETFEAIVVANGHHSEPSVPELPTGDTFSGIELHSRAYIDPSEPQELRHKRVVVVGFGNSAVDIACDLARGNQDGPGQVFLSVRRGAWVLPKYALGRPLDQASSLPRFLPRAVRRSIAELWYRTRVGDPARFGLPKPDHRLGDAHPTISEDLYEFLAQGRIIAKPAIVRRAMDRISFADGSIEAVDAIVYATGYKVSFPFFDPRFVAAPNNELPLYLRVFHPEHVGLYFIGLCQPLGPILPIAEAQAKLVAAHFSGDYETPAPAVMRAAIVAEQNAVRGRFGSSPRHTMQVDFDDYLALLKRELGSKRVSD